MTIKKLVRYNERVYAAIDINGDVNDDAKSASEGRRNTLRKVRASIKHSSGKSF